MVRVYLELHDYVIFTESITTVLWPSQSRTLALVFDSHKAVADRVILSGNGVRRLIRRNASLFILFFFLRIMSFVPWRRLCWKTHQSKFLMYEFY